MPPMSVKLVEPFQISPSDHVVLVVGPTGAGKTTLINSIAGSAVLEVGVSLLPHTKSISAVKVRRGNENYIFLDTPGFDGDDQPSGPGQGEIANISKTLARIRCPIKGILYAHRISDNRVAFPAVRDFAFLCRMCGEEMFGNFVFVLTHGHPLPTATVSQRQTDFRKMWRPKLGIEAKTVLCDLGRPAAEVAVGINAVWTAVQSLPSSGQLAVVKEMLPHSLFEDTTVGRDLAKEIKRQKGAWAKIRRTFRGLFR